MTSKEYIQGVLYNLEEALKLAKETNNKDLEFDYEMQIKSYNQVLKDLKILDILKNQLEVYDTDFVNEDGDDIFAIRLNILSEYEFKIIEEWLNSGNNL